MKVRIVEDVSTSEELVTAIYIRVTKEESVATDLSIPNQRARSLEICSERGWSPVRLYVEPKHVGGDLGPLKRPALAHLLRDVEAGRVSRVLVRHTDRLWRGSSVQDVILDALRRTGTELWDFGGLREQRSAGGRFALKVLGAAAELEKNLTGERIREMKRGKAKAGKVGGGPPPFGYTSQSRVKREARLLGMSDEEAERKAVQQCPMSRCLYADEYEAEIVKLIFDLYLEKRWGCRRIADELNRRGARRRGGGAWVPTKVGRVVNDPVVAGFMSYDEDAYAKGLASRRPRFRQTLYQGTHPAIIEANIWHEAQRLKIEVNLPKLRTKSASSARTYPLTGVLTCGACGAHMRGRSSGSESFGTYVCSRRAYLGKDHGCAGASMHQRWAETTVWSYLDGLFQAPELVTRIVEEAATKRRGGRPEIKARLEAVRAEASALESKQRKWMERFEEANDAASDLLWQRLKELEARRGVLSEEAKLLEAQLAGTRERQLSAEEISQALAKLQGFAAAPAEKRRVLVERLVHRHDLRIRVLDGRRLVVSIRLDPLGEGEGRGKVGSRVVLVSPGTQRSDEGGRDRKTRPVCPDSPVPGGPASKTLWPPATATSTAARARAWPRTSAMSTEGARETIGAPRARVRSGRSPRKAPTSSPRSWTPWTLMPSTTSASAAHAAGITMPRSRAARARIAAASTPRTLRTAPSRPSSPSTSRPSSASARITSSATRTASAIGRSRPQPGLRSPAGARLIVTFLSGRSWPTVFSALWIRVAPSRTDCAGSPTTLYCGKPRSMRHSTSTSSASMPTRVHD